MNSFMTFLGPYLKVYVFKENHKRLTYVCPLHAEVSNDPSYRFCHMCGSEIQPKEIVTKEFIEYEDLLPDIDRFNVLHSPDMDYPFFILGGNLCKDKNIWTSDKDCIQEINETLIRDWKEDFISQYKKEIEHFENSTFVEALELHFGLVTYWD